jgi:Protein of unknown function (DUF1592)/Protein of unknown function (DUF1595)/Protein of unknown function (DUF1588)
MVSKVLSWLAVGATAAAMTGCTGQIGQDPTDMGGPGTSTTTGGTGGPGATTGGSPTGTGGGTTTTGGTGGVIDGKWQPPACKPDNHAFASGRLWQITDEQYVNAVKDVLGITLAGTDTQISGLNTTGEYTNLSETSGAFTDMLALNYQVAAQKVSTQAMTAASMNRLLGTTGSTAPTTAQLQTFINSKVARLWRRPVSAGELTALTKIYTDATANTADGGAPHGMDLLVQTVLQAPSFLFRTELGANNTPAATSFKLTPYELAGALSFLFTNSVPDDALWAAAANSTLTDPMVLSAQVNRIMALPAAQNAMAKYVSYWLWIERAPAREKDYTLYPEYSMTLQQAVYQSGFAWIKDIVLNGDLTQIFTSNKYFVNKEMSTVYGIPGGTGTTPTSLQQVTSTAPERSLGVFSQPAVLVATNKRPGILDPVHHGLFVLEDLLAGADVGIIPGPPANALSVAATMMGNERELVDKRKMTAPCNGCHSNFDGFGLTRYRYDSIGRYSETRYVNADQTVMPATYKWVTNPTPLDQSATIPDLVGADLKGPLAGPDALAAELNGADVRRRVAYSAGAHLALFVMGTDANLPNSCELQTVKENFYKSGSFKDFYSGLATSSGFVTRDPGM